MPGGTAGSDRFWRKMPDSTADDQKKEKKALTVTLRRGL